MFKKRFHTAKTHNEEKLQIKKIKYLIEMLVLSVPEAKHTILQILEPLSSLITLFTSINNELYF